MYSFATIDAIPDFEHLQAVIVLECVHFVPRHIYAQAHDYFAGLENAPDPVGRRRTKSNPTAGASDAQNGRRTRLAHRRAHDTESKTPSRKRLLRVILDSEDEDDEDEKAAPTYPVRYLILDERKWEIYEVRSASKATSIANNPAIQLGKGVQLYLKDYYHDIINDGINEDREQGQGRELAVYSKENPKDVKWQQIYATANARSRKKAGIPEDVPDGTPLYYWTYKAVVGLLDRE